MNIEFIKMDFEKLKKQKKHILLAKIGLIVLFMLSVCFLVFFREDDLSTIRFLSVNISICSVYCFIYTFMALSDLYDIINFASENEVLRAVVECNIKYLNDRPSKKQLSLMVYASGKDYTVAKHRFTLKNLIERTDIDNPIVDIQNKRIYIPFGFEPEQLDNADADLTSFKNFIADAASSPLIKTKHSYR